VAVTAATGADAAVSAFLNLGLSDPGSQGPAPPGSLCPPGRFSRDRGVATCSQCPAKTLCGTLGTVTPTPCTGLGYLCPPGSAALPTAPSTACFASGSTVAVWTSNGTHDTLITQPGWVGVGAMVVAGLSTGFDVPCNGVEAPDRLPAGVSMAGVASAAMAPAGGALVLTNGSVVVVGSGNATGYTSTLTQARFTTACVVDVRDNLSLQPK
jgi:hypothetical protein